MNCAEVAGGGASAALGSPAPVGAEPEEGIPRVGSALEAARRGCFASKTHSFLQILQQGSGYFAVQRLTIATSLANRGRALTPQQTAPKSPGPSHKLCSQYVVWEA